MRLLFFLLLGLGVITVFYFSWLPSPRLHLTNALPEWLSHWADKETNMNVRTAVPFLFLGLLAGLWLHYTSQPWRHWAGTWMGLIAVAFIAEIGQLSLPLRHFDWGDVAWGSIGAVIGLALTGLISVITSRTAHR